METRSSYFLVGLFVLVTSLALAAFGVWLAKADIDQRFDLYEIVFDGSVGGLQEGSQVQYRGVPVGRVREIGIDPDNVTQIVALIEVEADTPVKEDTSAELAMQGITGLANIELSGGSNASATLETGDDGTLPRIHAAPSAIEQVFQSTPELLANAVSLLERLSVLASAENVEAFSDILAHVESLTGTLSESRGDLSTLLSETATASEEIGAVAGDARLLVGELTTLAGSLGEQAGAIGSGSDDALGEVEEAAKALKNLSWRLDRTFADIERPLDDFGQSGLYDFTEMVREMRQLVASLTRITKEFERDPAGFLIGGSQRGFTPQ